MSGLQLHATPAPSHKAHGHGSNQWVSQYQPQSLQIGQSITATRRLHYRFFAEALFFSAALFFAMSVRCARS